jgi:predicted PurR-regulated permease PerM|tara:strand:+ start:411 stop:695 length:285 start_codon:yes stop_codon:yes gene_type:complete
LEEKLIKMKIFVYKALFVLIGLFFLFNFTIGYQIRKIENNISNINSEENIKFFKEKIKEEIEAGLEKDQILNEEERLLISRFLKKIILELELNK